MYADSMQRDEISPGKICLMYCDYYQDQSIKVHIKESKITALPNQILKLTGTLRLAQKNIHTSLDVLKFFT